MEEKKSWRITMGRLQMQRQWNRFVAVFNALGSETHGMTPEAASVLAQACTETLKNPNNGYRPLKTGTSPLINTVIDIPVAFKGCPTFWNIDFNNLRAKITNDGCNYVLAHQNVFSLLAGLI